jgi:hypothetical protein
MIPAIPFAMPCLHIVSQAFEVSVSSPLIPCMKKLSSWKGLGMRSVYQVAVDALNCTRWCFELGKIDTYKTRLLISFLSKCTQTDELNSKHDLLKHKNSAIEIKQARKLHIENRVLLLYTGRDVV